MHHGNDQGAWRAETSVASVLVNFSWSIFNFKGTKAMTRGKEGRNLCCLREVHECLVNFYRSISNFKGTKATRGHGGQKSLSIASMKYIQCTCLAKFLQSISNFKGTKAMTRGHRGNRLCCLKFSPTTQVTSGNNIPIQGKLVICLAPWKKNSITKISS